MARAVSPAQAVEWARTLGHYWWLPLAYIAAYALLNIVCIPPLVLSIVGAVVWGWLAGGCLELIAATLGSVPPYLIARSAFRQTVADRLRELRAIEWIHRADEMAEFHSRLRFAQ